ncbi:MAG: hypothetical protein ACM3JD_12745 [Rudaea sp.]
MAYRTGAVFGLVVLGAAAIFYFGSRLTTDALNMVVGLMCGVLATIPVSAGLLIALLRQRNREQGEDDPEPEFRDPIPYGRPGPQNPQPQIIVIAPPQSQYGGGVPPYASGPYSNYPPSMNEDVIDSRDWRIIGDDEG